MIRGVVWVGLILSAYLGAVFVLGVSPSLANVVLKGVRVWVQRGRRAPNPTLRSARQQLKPAAGGGKLGDGGGHLVARERIVLATGSPVTAIAEHDGALVLGTFDQGLFRLNAGEQFAAYQPLAVDPQINDLAQGVDGKLYIATAHGAYALDHTGAATRLSPGAFAAAAWWKGQPWFASRQGLSTVAPGGGWLTRGPQQGFPADNPDALAACGEVLCAGATDGLWLFDGRRSVHRSAADGSLPTDWVTAVAYEDGVIWAGTFDGGLARLGLQRDRRFAPEDGLADGRVFPHALIAKGGAFAGTPSGLVTLSAERARSTALALGEITAVAPSQRGGVWVACPGAVSRVEFLEGAR